MVADTLQSGLPLSLKHCVSLAKEPGSSSWLTVLPILEHGFHLHKSDFWDALSLHYDITPSNTSSTCQCGTSFSVNHAMVCPFGGFPKITNNEVWDHLTASLLTKVCHNVATEPSLQPITSKTFLLHWPTPLMMLIWILRLNASGVGARIHILILGYFIPMPPFTTSFCL